LCGQPPFTATNTPSMLVKHLSEKPIPVDERWPDLPQDLARAVMICLEKDPADRFPSAAAFSLALSGVGMPTLATRASAPAQPREGRVTASRRPTPELPDTFRERYDAARQGSYTPAPYAPQTPYSSLTPSQEEVARWNAPMVVAFRRKLAPYLAVNAILVPISIFGDRDFLFFTIMWSVFLAFKYSKLWAANYDWRDVFRQPRDRLMFDVAAETLDDARALFDKEKRGEVRARARSRGPGLFSPMPAPASQPYRAGASPTMMTATAGLSQRTFDDSRYGGTVREAESDHREIHRQLLNMTPDDREQIPDVATSADAVLRKVEQLASSLMDLERSTGRETTESVEKEIDTLELEANPLEYEASEERVRRLAYLRRQRRALVEVARKRKEATEKLEHCRQLLRTMRLELARFRSGGFSAPQGRLTMVTQQAQSVVREMGYLSEAKAEVNAL